jgi:predicted ATPase with chaperone activity
VCIPVLAAISEATKNLALVLLRSLRNIKTRISGPLLDRIDIHIEVPRVDYEKLSGDRLGESSEAIRQ